MNNKNIRPYGRLLLIAGALCMIAAIFLPMWQIELYAPQYPEGLELLIYPNALAGDVEVINGLNHYIGMKTLHTDDFMEFKILPYLLGFFGLCFILAAIIGKRKLVYILFGLFVLFAIVSMLDFYRWNYNYGHNLDPHAAIKVPGQSYQPPLLGYKQLLNFGAYSIPDQGGLLFILAGIILLLLVFLETGTLKKIFQRKKAPVMLFLLLLLGCSAPGPRPVIINEDECAYCKMSIIDPNFAAQLVTDKGRHYIFDDITCMADYAKDNADKATGMYYVADFLSYTDFIEVGKTHLFHSDSLRSPMAGNIAAFSVRDSMDSYRVRLNGTPLSWSKILNSR